MYMERTEREALGLDPMLDNEKLKTRSYRVTEAMEQKIKDITDELGEGASQKDAFLKMIASVTASKRERCIRRRRKNY